MAISATEEKLFNTLYLLLTYDPGLANVLQKQTSSQSRKMEAVPVKSVFVNEMFD